MSVQAHAWAKRARTGSGTLKAVLVAIADYADANGQAWPSQEQLAEDTEFSVRAVRNAIAALVDAGLVERRERRRKDGTRASDILVLSMGEPLNRHEMPADGEQPARRSDQPARRSKQPARGAGLTTFEPSLNHQGNRQVSDAARGARALDGGGETAGSNADLIAKGKADRFAAVERGVALICSNTSRPVDLARKLMGHWLSIARDEAVFVLSVIEDADGRELADFSSWVEIRLRKRREEQDRLPALRRPADRPTGLAGRLIRLHQQSQQGAFDVEPPSVDANSPAAEPSRGEDRGVAWLSGGPSRPSDAILRAAGQGGHDSRASSALRRLRAAGG